ncbi:hypothetical protein FSP39_007581 [Pinctada imbricata]|uniref:Uncharacterized protein n=1 Tax=Pinctada imbricata TaxID=66713 RepID=A0AA88XUM9_PINIB|nr:hypothetical protein FSP39_007581 [Pinctada imbricata]
MWKTLTCTTNDTEMNLYFVDGSSSSESEYSKTLNIITRLSQKYLGPSKKEKKKKPKSPDIDYDGDVENSTGNSDSGSTSSQKSSISMFDFDEDDPLEMELSPMKSKKPSSANVGQKKKTKSKCTSESKTSIQGRKNVSDNKEKPKEQKGKCIKGKKSRMMEISPIPSSDTLVSNDVDTTNEKGCVQRKSSRDKKGNNVSFSPIVTDMNLLNLSSNRTPLVTLEKDQNVKVPPQINKLDLSMNLDQSTSVSEKADLTKGKKRKTEASTTNTSSVKVLKTSKEQNKTQGEKNKPKQKRKDSGVFTSPKLVQKTLPLLIAKDTSTPADNKAHCMQSSADDSTFGFGSMASPMEVSPVKRLSEVTPLSDYASMDSSLTVNQDESWPKKSKQAVQQKIELFMDAADDDEEVSFTRKLQKSYKPKKKGHKKSSQKNAMEDDWMTKMNTEFSDIEKFELSIEG